ncbi:MAG: DUF4340 domain-containing protein [Phycisphaeraceae bacterium]
MNFKTTLFLLALLVIVGGFFWWAATKYGKPEAPGSGGGTQTSAQGTPLLPDTQFKADDVAAITIDHGGKTVRLEKDAAKGDWAQTQPVHFPLNDWSARGVADDAAALRWSQKLAPGEDDAPKLDTLGLDKPAATVAYFGKDAKPLATIKLGKTSVGGRAYVMTNDDPHVYVVSDALHNRVIKEGGNDFRGWRKRNLAVPAVGNLDRVALERDGQMIELFGKDGVWTLAAPHAGRADTEAVASLIGAVNSMSIQKFTADNPADLSVYGLDEPAVVLSLRQVVPDQAGAESAKVRISGLAQTLRIGGATDLGGESLFATWRSDQHAGSVVVFEIAKADADKFEKKVDDLRDPRITTVKPADVREIALYPKEGPAFKLLRTTDGWSFGDPSPGYQADAGEAAKLLDAITSAKATAYRLDVQRSREPDQTISLTAIGRGEPEVLRVFTVVAAASSPRVPSPTSTNEESPETQLLVLRNEETVGYLVPASALAPAMQPPLTFRDRQVLNLPHRITNLAIHQPDGTIFEFANQPLTTAATVPAGRLAATWKLTGQNRFETEALQDLLNHLQPLQATSWVLDQQSAIPMPDRSLVLRMTEPNGAGYALQVNIERNIAVLTEIEGIYKGAYGPDQLPAFKVDKALVAALMQEFRYRTVLSLGAEQIQQVTATREGQTVTVRKDSQDRYVADSGTEVDQSAAGGIYDTLAGLRAERFGPVEAAKIDLAKPNVTLDVATRDGQVHQVHLWPAENLARLNNGDMLIVLHERVMGRLAAPLTIKADAPRIQK